jgi:PAS domain S-box-containing protein
MNTQERTRNNHVEILIAEDSPTQADQLKYILEQHNYSVSIATNGKQALALMDHQKPTLVISDIVMPEMDGYELCRAMKSDEKLRDIPVILLTSLSGPEDVINGLKCGADNFIRKPCDERLLIGRIQYILANREVRRNEKMHIGVELLIGGEKHFITSERQQILDLLISTYDEAVHLNEDLKRREQQLDRANKILRGIYRIAKGLNSAMTQHEVVEHVLDRALELPDVRSGWLSLREGESGFRLVGSRGLPPALEIPGALEGDCLCRRKALAGEINKSMNITECERLQRAQGNIQGLRSHVTIPLRIGSRLLGILNLVGTEEVLFSDDDLAVLNGIGNQIGAALERTRMHEHLGELVKERTADLTAEITERKRAEEALRESELRFRSVWEKGTDGMRIINEEGIVVLVNDAYCKMTEKPREEIEGKPMSIIYEAAKQAEVLRKHQERFRSRNIPAYLERELVLWNGKRISLELSNTFLEIPHQPTLSLSVLRDITQRKQAEKQISMLAHAVRSISECVSITDMEDTVLFVNEAFLKTYGYDEHELLGKHISVVRPPTNLPEVVREILPATLRGGWYGELFNRRKDGSEFPVFLSTSVIRDEKGQPVALVGVAADITERKRAEEEWKKLQGQLIQAQKMESLGTLAGGIAHDFNNVLGIILGHASLLERSPADPRTVKTSTEAITKAGNRGASLVKQLLTIARKSDVLFEPVLLNDSVNELLKLLTETFPKTISISLDLEKNLPATVADPTQLHQVLLNLCVNARDAMPNGGTLTITTKRQQGETIRGRFPKAAAPEYIALLVADTGTGMNEATRSRIFEPFYTTKEIGKGTGLGLSLIYGILEKHNGFVDVESELGKGTTLHLYFPLSQQLVEPVLVQKQAPGELPGGNETILIVEDEEMLRQLVKAVLEGTGYTVLTASDGEEAVETYKRHQGEIQLVLSDMGLPKFGGYEVYQRLKNLNPAVRMIFASGYLEPAMKSQIFREGVRDFIQKPYDADEVLRAIRSVLDVA